MSRFSPQGVTPNRSGEILAGALERGLANFLNARRQRRLDAEHDADRTRAASIQDAQLAGQGIHLTKPGELPPTFDVNVSGGPDPDTIVSRAITSALGRGTSSPATTVPTESPFTVALSRHLEIGPGYYIDRDEQQRAREQAGTTAFNQAFVRALGGQLGQQVGNPGATERKRQLEEARIAEMQARTGQLGRLSRAPAPRIVRSAEGLFTVGSDGTAVPLESNGQPLHVPAGSRSVNPNAETPDHRSARQGFSATQRLLDNTQRQLGQMDRSAPPLVQYPGVVTGTSADSAAARDFTAKRNQLEQRADSLRGEAERYSRTMGRAGVNTQPARPAVRAPVQAQPDYDHEAALYQAGIARIKQNFTGAERDRRLRAASDRYNQRVRALATGQQP